LNDHFFETGWLTYLCGLTALYTAYKAWKTTDLKKRFSYSTVGQLSYIITAILLGTDQALLGAVLHIITHSVAKANLFFFAGIAMSLIDTVNASKVAALVTRHRLLGICASIAGLSITGFPFLAGYYSKDTMLLEEIHRHHYAAALFLALGSLMNFIYIWPLLKATFFTKHVPHQRQTESIPLLMYLPLIVGTCLVVGFSQYAYYVMRIFNK
jgi:NADH:ubiquinone oxidoreductase subunit 5 (subunit L)/multisubunit Na+/H+ antiporter MnhA subunit